MVSMNEAAKIAMRLPEVTVAERYGNHTWLVRGRAFAWERPFRNADIERFGSETPPDGPILAVRVDDLADKEAVLAAGTTGVFTIPHFDGYPAVLIQLKAIAKPVLREAITDAWLASAPEKLVNEYLADER